MPEDLLTLSTGLSNAKLESANAVAGDVKSGKTFYAGDKTLKTGTLTLSGNAAVGNVLSGKTFYSNSWTKQTGTMTNRDAWNFTIDPGNSVTIPAGYHSGSGKVTANISSTTLLLVFGGSHVRGSMNFIGSSYLTCVNEMNDSEINEGNAAVYVPDSHMKLLFTVKVAGKYRWLSTGKVDFYDGWHTIRYNGTSHDAPADFTVTASVGDTFEIEHTGSGDWAYWGGSCLYSDQ